MQGRKCTPSLSLLLQSGCHSASSSEITCSSVPSACGSLHTPTVIFMHCTWAVQGKCSCITETQNGCSTLGEHTRVTPPPAGFPTCLPLFPARHCHTHQARSIIEHSWRVLENNMLLLRSAPAWHTCPSARAAPPMVSHAGGQICRAAHGRGQCRATTYRRQEFLAHPRTS